MSLVFTVLLAVHIVLALAIIVIILLQQGKGATAGAAFGSGASSTVFGSKGSATFLTRFTAVLATLFLANSLLLGYLYGQEIEQTSLLDQIAAPATEVAAPPVPEDVPQGAAMDNDVPVVPAQ